jgi:hypothetical protein
MVPPHQGSRGELILFLSSNQLTRFESEATDIHLALRAHGLEDGYPIIINNRLRYVLHTWETNALKWGYNPGSWSFIAQANMEQAILMEGLGNLFATNLAQLDNACSEHCSPSIKGAGDSESSEIEVGVCFAMPPAVETDKRPIVTAYS